MGGLSFGFRSEGYLPHAGWRPLRLKKQLQKGWDVFDLQCKLAYAGFEIDRDGYLGELTDGEIRGYQDTAGLVVDGIAGLATQTSLGAACAREAAQGHLARRVLGTMTKEASLLCGIYTAPYTDGSRDRGPVQMNSRYHPDPLIAFDVGKCLPALVTRTKAQRARYVGWGTEEQLAWAAAQGHWNSPVNADKLARGEPVPDAFAEYVEAVTAYV